VILFLLCKVNNYDCPFSEFLLFSLLSLDLSHLNHYLSSLIFKQYNNDIMPPSIHSDIGDRRLGLYPDYTAYPGIKQRKEESKFIEKAAAAAAATATASSTTLSKKKQLSLLLEERRRARFSIVKTAFLEDVPLASQMTETEKNTLWWSEDETAIAKQCIATICDTAQCRPNCGDSSSSYISVLGRLYEQCHDSKSTEESSPVDENDQKLLSQLARNSHSFRRGLETRIIESTSREQRKAGARETLVYAVQLLHQNKAIDVESKAEVIRKCSERMSRGARLFAQSLAQADVESIKPTRPKLSSRVRRVKLPKKLLSEYFVSYGSAQH
jgi:hypothetical protein